MTKEEVIKAEGIVGNFDNDMFTVTWELLGKEVYISYEFLDGKLERLGYDIPEGNFTLYGVMRRELGRKYGTGDLTEKELKARFEELSTETEELPQIQATPKEKRKRLEEIKKEKERLWRQYNRYNDIALRKNWVLDDDIIGQEDKRVEMGDLVYTHTRKTESTQIAILFWVSSNYEKIISIEYKSPTRDEYVKNTQEQTINDLKNSI